MVIWSRSIFPHEDLLEFGSLGHHIWQLDAIGSELAMNKEHVWSSRNFRIEPRTKKMIQSGGPGVYLFGRGMKYWGKGLLCHPLSCSIDRSDRSLLGKSRNIGIPQLLVSGQKTRFAYLVLSAEHGPLCGPLCLDTGCLTMRPAGRCHR